MFPNQVQTTLSVVEDERDRFMAKLLVEEKSRKSMEGEPANLKIEIPGGESKKKREKKHPFA